MFDYLKHVFKESSMTLSELEDAVIQYNNQVPRDDRIRSVNLSEGNYIDRRKYVTMKMKWKDLKKENSSLYTKLQSLQQKNIALQKELNDIKCDSALQRVCPHYMLTSKLAQMAVYELFKNQSFKLQNGALMGVDTCIEDLKKQNLDVLQSYSSIPKE